MKMVETKDMVGDKVSTWLGAQFSGNAKEAIAKMRANGAPPSVLDAMRRNPADEYFASTGEVTLFLNQTLSTSPLWY